MGSRRACWLSARCWPRWPSQRHRRAGVARLRTGTGRTARRRRARAPVRHGAASLCAHDRETGGGRARGGAAGRRGHRLAGGRLQFPGRRTVVDAGAAAGDARLRDGLRITTSSPACRCRPARGDRLEIGDWFPDIHSWPATGSSSAWRCTRTYLLSRAAFTDRGQNLGEAARSLGLTRRRVWWRDLAGGPAGGGQLRVGVDGTLADFGTVAYFSVDNSPPALSGVAGHGRSHGCAAVRHVAGDRDRDAHPSAASAGGCSLRAQSVPPRRPLRGGRLAPRWRAAPVVLACAAGDAAARSWIKGARARRGLPRWIGNTTLAICGAAIVLPVRWWRRPPRAWRLVAARRCDVERRYARVVLGVRLLILSGAVDRAVAATGWLGVSAVLAGGSVAASFTPVRFLVATRGRVGPEADQPSMDTAHAASAGVRSRCCARCTG